MVGITLFTASRITATFAAALGMSMAMTVTLNAQQRVCIATFNMALHGQVAGEICQRLDGPTDPQAKKLALIVQTVRPDILLVNELDHDVHHRSAKLLNDNYFAIAQGDQSALPFPHVYVPSTNTGLPSGRDLDGNGRQGEPNDAWGYGDFPGQYGFAIFSRFPLDLEHARTFQQFRWSQLSDAMRPCDPVSGKPFHDDATWSTLRLSSKNHVDLPILIGNRRLHLLASHPTPPVFDGAEDRNGCRNHDEIQFWIDYLSGPRAVHLIDDQNRVGGVGTAEWFVIAGDLNSDPWKGDGRREAIQRLLRHDRLQDTQPRHRGRREFPHLPNAGVSTADFGNAGRLRVDYVLPCRELTVKSSGVFWPNPNDKDHDLVSASDHRLVWVEVEIP